MRKLVWTMFAGSLAACAVDPSVENEVGQGDEVATDEQSIIGGVTDFGDACVVAVFAHPPGVNSGSLCTGTVIGPRTVLTAAHCVDPALVGAGQVFEILSGTTLTLPGIVASSTTFDPAWNPANLFGGHDIGIVHTVNPMPVPPCPLAGVNFGLPVRLVGYGSNTHSNTGAGTKREVTTNIVAANAILIQDGNSNQQTCHGDSGGPAFQTVNGQQAVVGVTSFGQDQSATSVCFGGGFHNRVDAFAPFILGNTF